MTDMTEKDPVKGEIMVLPPASQENDISVVGPQSLKYWELVQRVRKQFQLGATTTVAACEAAGVCRKTYYEAIRDPYVQGMVASQMDALAQASLEVIEQSWIPVLVNVVGVARDGSGRDAVQAAKFLKDVKDDLDAIARGDSRSSQESDAAKALRSFLGGGKGKLKLKQITQEIELSE